jgi:hypothetical protein
MTQKNRHPADRLADARKAKKAAEEEESAARAAALATLNEWNTEVLEGEEAVVTRDHQNWKGNLDPSLMKLAGLNPDEFRKPTYPVDYLKTTKKKKRGEPVWPSDQEDDTNDG